MSNFYILKLNYKIQYLRYLLDEYINKKNDDKSAKKFIDFNNRMTLKRIKNKELNKIAILLPHCIQKYDCNFKITHDINNCRVCGQCDISDILKIKDKIKGIDVKVATGGTLARIYLKEYRPSLVIAVACKRDLISGVRDSIAIPVYGIFNKIMNQPCKNTKVSIEEIKTVLREVGKIK